MKKIFLISILGLTIGSVNAQDINDAMRYSQPELSGTARFKAMSGAFGALGGDLSAIGVNPAGSVIFANNQIGVTLANSSNKNNSNYFGNNTTDSRNNFNINQIGGVFVFSNNRRNNDWSKFALSVNYENTKNLSNSIYIAGTNPNNSIDNYFLNYANGVQLGTINGYSFDQLYYDEQQAYLGYNSYIIDPTTTANTNSTYISNVVPGNYYHTNSIQTTGYNGKLAFNFATQYKDKLSFGLTLNSHFSDFRQASVFTETNSNGVYTSGSTVDNIRFSNDLYTTGSGFSFQLGAIVKATKEVRFGASYQSPIWYRFNDQLTQSVRTSGYGLDSAQNSAVYSTVVTDPNTTMIFEPYKLSSPGKWTGSFAYVFGKRGLLSIDYNFKDYSKMQYAPKNDFTNTNATMSKLLTSTSEVRVGAEYKIKKVSLRGGYRWEQSPYKDKTTIGDLTGFSGGLGFNFGATKLDLSYNHSQRDYNQQMFNTGLTDAAKIKNTNNTVSVSLLFEL